MNSLSNSVGDFPREQQPARAKETSPFLWSVRREVWENRSIYIVPLVVATVVFSGFMVSTVGMAGRRRAVLLLDVAQQRNMISQPYHVAAMMLAFTVFIVGIFYCLDALHGERRERSILFWKSLPVSDLTTVISKITIPLVVLPLVTFAVIVATHFAMLLWSSVILLPSGLAATTWGRVNWFEQSGLSLYGLIAVALWHAPIYGWLLLISGLVRRAPFLWAVLPLVAISFLEKIALNTTYFAAVVVDRLTGWGDAAFSTARHSALATGSITQITPLNYLSAPSLWIGLVFAMVCVAGAIRLRRYRGPL